MEYVIRNRRIIPIPEDEDYNPCHDCGVPLIEGLDRCYRCRKKHVTPNGILLRCLGAVALGTLGWVLLLGLSMVSLAGMQSSGVHSTGGGFYYAIGFPGVATLYGAKALVKPVGGRSLVLVFAPAIPVFLALLVLLQ